MKVYNGNEVVMNKLFCIAFSYACLFFSDSARMSVLSGKIAGNKSKCMSIYTASVCVWFSI